MPAKKITPAPGFKRATELKSTWKGRRGTQQAHHMTGTNHGPRVIVQTWDDDGSVDVRAIEGDGWREATRFRVYAQVCYPIRPTATALEQAIELCRTKLPGQE